MSSLLLLALACAPHRPPEAATPSSAESCSSTGCSLGDARGPELSEADFIALLDAWAAEPLGESTLALDTLLFDAARSSALLELHGERLPEARRAWLEAELARDEVVIEMRLVDERGRERGALASAAFPLREKQHLVFQDTGTLGWLETGGKVKRVGLGHLWSRW